jgi:hypothetical protein
LSTDESENDGGTMDVDNYKDLAKRVRRLAEWEREARTKMSAFCEMMGGAPPPPEDLSPELVDVLSKVLVSAMVGRTYGDDMIEERIRYQTNLVRHADLRNLHPFFASADIEDGDMYIWLGAAHVYGEYLASQTGFQATITSTARDIYRIQHPRTKSVAKPSTSAHTNKKKARGRKEAATPRSERDAPALRASARLRWKSAIRLQIKLNRMHRVQTAKNIVEGMRRQKVRRAAEAAKAARKEAPFSVRGPSGPAPKHAFAHETPSVADQAKRECGKAGSIERSNEHRLQLQEKESLRLAQAEQRFEALRIASKIQNGDGDTVS